MVSWFHALEELGIWERSIKASFALGLGRCFQQGVVEMRVPLLVRSKGLRRPFDIKASDKKSLEERRYSAHSLVGKKVESTQIRIVLVNLDRATRDGIRLSKLVR